MYGDLDRPPLRANALNRALDQDGYRIEVLDSAGSTNAVVAERARQGEAHGLVVVAEEQTAGRGRLDRTWVSPPRAGLTFSVLVRPSGPPTWVPLLAGLGVAQALRRQAEVDAELKWPNDVLVGGRKVCGLLAERRVAAKRGNDLRIAHIVGSTLARRSHSGAERVEGLRQQPIQRSGAFLLLGILIFRGVEVDLTGGDKLAGEPCLCAGPICLFLPVL